MDLPEKNRKDVGTVEELLIAVDEMDVQRPDDNRAFTLWVPSKLTLNGEAIPQEVAMAIVGDRLLSKNLWPDGCDRGEGGRLYRYMLED